MSAILGFFNPQVITVLVIVVVINILSNVLRHYVVLNAHKRNEKRLEEVLQDSEARMRVMLQGLETSREHLLKTLQEQKEKQSNQP